ncbi:Uu.00g092420.m01.CDS01 [Anthostomella pinea]|uniref:dolichol kinase n=1 Tax=Anthostomella pinea TaxID=933095 RepID=A0AAI8YKC4_9PEZI|nr:Uu.00g092420.m01.CDS01 [Anthostomella pinea]
MPEYLDPFAAYSDASNDPRQPVLRPQDALRLLTRSPHPYHRQNFELLDSVNSYAASREKSFDANLSPSTFPDRSREPTPSSDSGTEADDEHFLKGLPAPKRWHKGLRGRNEVLSGTSTPLPSPARLEEEGRRLSYTLKKDTSLTQGFRRPKDNARRRRRRELVRRATELLILGVLGFLVQKNPQVRPVWRKWSQELGIGIAIWLLLVLLYPLRLCAWAFWHRTPSRKIPLSLPSSFDPAPLFYPPAITLFASFLIAVDNEAVLLPNIILAICSLPPALVPTLESSDQGYNSFHWALSCAPLLLSKVPWTVTVGWADGGTTAARTAAVPAETAVLLYPLYCNLVLALRTLTTTSLLTAEVQLLAIALIDVLMLSISPQASIMKAMLWVGGFDILVSCSHAIMWGIALARVPKWRFKRPPSPTKRSSTFLSSVMSWRRVRHDLFHAPMDSSSCSSCEAIDDPNESDDAGARASKEHLLVKTITLDGAGPTGLEGSSSCGIDAGHELRSNVKEGTVGSPLRRHTLPSTAKPLRKSNTHTPSGRKKRSASISVRAFFSLTQKQAAVRKWIYAIYVYACILGAIFAPVPFVGVKEVVMDEALHGYEPVGWALGYLFGDLPRFRWEVVSCNLQRWICLPPRWVDRQVDHPPTGWLERLQVSFVGEANTRLLLSAYCIVVIAIGLIVVLRLSPFCEVDTRRKVFHFMMVAMFLPATYIDPTFVALALSIILALFLLLDLLRASQLPPLSKPLAYFLAPYVDGRDLRGPVVISHIFLLIGCAIPLWLSLGSLPRTGTGYLEGWGVPTREVAMVSGVVCVGLGDAAASLIGRRYGHRKWLWGGGKSLEGSAAFAAAVFVGLVAAHIWLRLGGWRATTGHPDSWGATLQKAGTCAGISSLTEAVLTGGNDNVIVPVILWTCVKSLGV